jgi:hypothetical protein
MRRPTPTLSGLNYTLLPAGRPGHTHVACTAPLHCAALTEAKLHALHWVALPGVTTNLPAGCSRGSPARAHICSQIDVHHQIIIVFSPLYTMHACVFVQNAAYIYTLYMGCSMYLPLECRDRTMQTETRHATQHTLLDAVPAGVLKVRPHRTPKIRGPLATRR